MIATGAHTQTKSTSGKKFAFASRKFSPSATVLKLFSSALFFSDFKFFRPSEALARENFPISNVSRPRLRLDARRADHGERHAATAKLKAREADEAAEEAG